MKIVFSKDGLVDLETPIVMTEEQLKQFVEFLGSLSEEEVVLSEVQEPPGSPPGASSPRRWSSRELLELLGTGSNQSLANKLNRSTMSVRMKRGEFVMDFLGWLRRKGYRLPATIAQVEEYLAERTGRK
ncbi:MAG: hypothetical protein ACE5IJ_04565 [Thermoplasmata archaeon]